MGATTVCERSTIERSTMLSSRDKHLTMGARRVAELEITAEIEPDPEPVDANNNGIPDAIETGQALERAEIAQEQADEAQATAESAQSTADLAVDEAFDAHGRISALEQGMAAMAGVIDAQNAQIQQLTDLAAANATAAANLLDTHMRGNQPPDEPPSSGHWLNRKIGF